jgi:Tfp pilus assembly PilM family ATPase
MKVRDEISSTEKLLDLIRKKGGQREPAVSKPSETPAPGQGFFSSLSKIVPLRKTLTVGVDIGHKTLRLVKTTQLSGKKWTLIDFASIPFGQLESRDNPRFPSFLKSEVEKFCDIPASQIWAIASAAQFDVRQISIPRVDRKEMANAVYWTLQKEIPFDEKEMVFDFEVQGEVVEKGAPKWLVTAYLLPKQEVDKVRKLFSQAGMPLSGMTTTPFALQNIFSTGMVPTPDETFASLFIGNNFSRIDIYKKAKLVLTRGIKAGAGSMVESLMEEFNEKRDGRPGRSEKAGPMDAVQARQLLFGLSTDANPPTGGDGGFVLSEEEIFDLVSPALERLIRQVERTFEHYVSKAGEDGIQKIYITSAMNISRSITQYVGEQLGMESDVFDPVSGESSAMGSAIAAAAVSERIALAPALGAAISDNAYTPNLIYTSKDRRKPERIAFINRVIFAGFIAAFLICSGVMVYLGYAGYHKKASIAALEGELATFKPLIERDAIVKMTEQLRQRQQTARAYSQRYLGMATIAELSLLTPPEIRLVNLKAELGVVDGGKTKGVSPHVEVEGVVLGERKDLEGVLAGYVMKLGASPMFKRVDIQKSQFATYRDSDFLRFVIDIKLT